MSYTLTTSEVTAMDNRSVTTMTLRFVPLDASLTSLSDIVQAASSAIQSDGSGRPQDSTITLEAPTDIEPFGAITVVW